MHNQLIKSGLYRFWNVIKYPITLVLVFMLIKIINDTTTAHTLRILVDFEYWDNLLISIISDIKPYLLAGLGATVDKLKREYFKLNQSEVEPEEELG